jgi:hypothetical protein
LVPVTVRVKAAPPAWAEVGEIEVVVGTGLVTVKAADAVALCAYPVAVAKAVMVSEDETKIAVE